MNPPDLGLPDMTQLSSSDAAIKAAIDWKDYFMNEHGLLNTSDGLQMFYRGIDFAVGTLLKELYRVEPTARTSPGQSKSVV